MVELGESQPRLLERQKQLESQLVLSFLTAGWSIGYVLCTRPIIWIQDQYVRKQDGVHLFKWLGCPVLKLHPNTGPFCISTIPIMKSSVFRSPLYLLILLFTLVQGFFSSSRRVFGRSDGRRRFWWWRWRGLGHHPEAPQISSRCSRILGSSVVEGTVTGNVRFFQSLSGCRTS